MGGRIAIELGLVAPERIRSLGLLCPAVAWIKRGLHPIVRLLRPEFGLLPHAIRRSTVASQFWRMFHDRDLIDPALADLVVDEFQRIYHTAGARYALLASARNIYLEAPFGRGGFYRRLADLEPPALFVWGSHDWLVPAAFSRHVRKWLPQRRAGDDRSVRPRAAGRAARGDQRAARSVSSAGSSKPAPRRAPSAWTRAAGPRRPDH